MLDFSLFLALTKHKSAAIPTAIYFHENQLTYPWSVTDVDVHLKRDFHYGFINFTSALVADKVFFNSQYHYNSFLDALPKFLKMYPDYNELWTINNIKEKAIVLYLGMELNTISPIKKRNEIPVILWNHRWEYDKNPTFFFETLKVFKAKNIAFQLIILGEKTKSYPKCFDEAKIVFKDECKHFGYVASKKTYYNLLQQADVLPVTSFQDFFGGSIVEAMSQGVIPLLPNRLAYAEHFPFEKYPAYVYNNDTEFYGKLKAILLNHTKEKTISTREMVLKYDWKNIISVYDEILTLP